MKKYDVAVIGGGFAGVDVHTGDQVVQHGDIGGVGQQVSGRL